MKQHLVLASAPASSCCGERRIPFTDGSPYTTVTPLLVFIAALVLAAIACLSAPALAQTSGKIGLIGDSMTVATNADEMCGAGKELPSCLDDKLGLHDLAWSHAGSAPSWSIASRLGYTFSQAVNVAEDGAQWKDALGQAARLSSDAAVDTIFINLGANDVCQSFGHDYTGDLQVIAQHIDDTLSYLLGILLPGARIYLTGIPNIVDLRNVMAGRRHNYIFGSCQAFWDLDHNEITEEAAASLCHAEGLPAAVCENLADWERVRDRLMDRLLSYYKDRYNVDEGPCGRVLNSANTAYDLDKAQQFNRALNTLLARKAAQYNGRNGVKIMFTNVLYNTPIQPNYVSRLDCYHPNRAGQMKMAQLLWQAFNRTSTGVYAIWVDEFENTDWCTQELGLPWASCWYHYGDDGFDILVDDQGWLKVQKDTGDQNRHFVVREVGDLSGMSAAWMSFNHKRENLDDGGDRVYFKVYKDGVWHLLDQFKGSGNDLGEHAGNFYDLTPYISADLRIMFETENQGSMRDGDRVKFDNLDIFAWGDSAPSRARVR
jgi:lysophospholipase L1-like esterase